MIREELMDNVYLTYVPSRKFKTGLLSAQMVAPLRRETASLNALLVNVLSQGTVNCPDMAALSARLDQLYGAEVIPTVRKKGENQAFGFVASCVDERFLPQPERLLEPLSDLLGEMFCHPVTRNGRLSGEYTAREKENLADLIRGEINDKRSYASRRLIAEMCREEPYGVSRLGEARDVERISLQRLNAHYKTILPQARLELFYCGSGERSRVAGMLRRAFASLPRQGGIEPAPTLRRPARERPKLVEEEMDVAQSRLCLGFRLEGEDPAAAMVMNAMFGGSGGSKLFMNVREKLSLCYYASSAYHRQKRLITVSSGIEFQNYQKAYDEIMAQLAAVQAGRLEDWELEGARSTLLNAYASMGDSQGKLENFYLGQAATGQEDTPELLAEQVRHVTAERIFDAMQTASLDTVYFLKGKETAE